MRTKFLLVINTINVILFIVVISIFLKKIIGIDNANPINIVAENVTKIHDEALGNEPIQQKIEKVVETEVVKENMPTILEEVKVVTTQSEQAKLVRKKDKVNKIQEITDELMDKTSNDLKNASTIHKPNMNDHSKDKFNMKLLVNQKLAIPLYDSEDKISKRMAKPNAKVPVSNVNYGNFSKVIISKKVYLIENKYIVQ
jgi:hypothetical protein